MVFVVGIHINLLERGRECGKKSSPHSTKPLFEVRIFKLHTYLMVRIFILINAIVIGYSLTKQGLYVLKIYRNQQKVKNFVSKLTPMILKLMEMKSSIA